MTRSWTSHLPPTASAPGMARTFVETRLTALFDHPTAIAETCEDLAVIVSELVTNAVQATTGVLQVDLAVDGRSVRLAVTDGAAGMPSVTGPAAFDQPYGRGLAIVAALSQDWGVLPVARTGRPTDGGAGTVDGVDGDDPAAGKTVWARLELAAFPDH